MMKVSRPKTLKENALESLRDAITQGVFKPGERLVERNLCESMEVSRTVVRECIRHLESEWLVVGVPNAGFAVATLNAEEVREIYDIRIMLECAAVQSCALNATAETIVELRKIHQSIEDYLQQGDVVNALKYSTEFYHLIFTTGRKIVSWSLAERLNGRISRLRALTLSAPGRSKTGPASLRSIIDAIEEHDTARSEELCAMHLEAAAQIALKLI